MLCSSDCVYDRISTAAVDIVFDAADAAVTVVIIVILYASATLSSYSSTTSTSTSASCSSSTFAFSSLIYLSLDPNAAHHDPSCAHHLPQLLHRLWQVSRPGLVPLLPGCQQQVYTRPHQTYQSKTAV
jgi:hypothetical protein